MIDLARLTRSRRESKDVSDEKLKAEVRILSFCEYEPVTEDQYAPSWETRTFG